MQQHTPPKGGTTVTDSLPTNRGNFEEPETEASSPFAVSSVEKRSSHPILGLIEKVETTSIPTPLENIEGAQPEAELGYEANEGSTLIIKTGKCTPLRKEIDAPKSKTTQRLIKTKAKELQEVLRSTGTRNTDFLVGARLLAFKSEWSQAPRWPRKIVTCGLAWKFLTVPPSNIKLSNQSYLFEDLLLNLKSQNIIEPCPNPLFQARLYCPENRFVSPPNSRSLGFKFPHRHSNIQIPLHKTNKVDSSEKRLHGKGRPSRRLLSCANPCDVQEIPDLPLEGQVLVFQGNALRPFSGSRCFRHSNEFPQKSTENSGPLSGELSGRLASLGQFKGAVQNLGPGTNQPLAKARFF